VTAMICFLPIEELKVCVNQFILPPEISHVQ
jgi:hypothetical protein